MLTLRLNLRQVPPDHRGGYDLAVDVIEETATDYATALASAKARVPDGWQAISVITVLQIPG